MAIIPARGGSKGIPRKNITLLNKKPLIAYTIDAALQSKYIDYTAVSTEDEEIAAISRSYGTDIIMRPAELADDTIATKDVLLHAVSTLAEEYDFLVLLQPTSPLRLSRHIDEAIELFESSCYDCLASVSPVEDHPFLIRQIAADGELSKLLPTNSSVRRQDMPEYYRINGAIYINRISQLNLETSFNDNQVGYIMPREYSIDIDNPIDLLIAEVMLKKN